mgnify:CR=1 FL=1
MGVAPDGLSATYEPLENEDLLFDAGLYCRADDRGDPVVQLTGTIQRYLGGELVFDESGALVPNPTRMKGNPTLVFDVKTGNDTIQRLGLTLEELLEAGRRKRTRAKKEER